MLMEVKVKVSEGKMISKGCMGVHRNTIHGHLARQIRNEEIRI